MMTARQSGAKLRELLNADANEFELIAELLSCRTRRPI
jgi:hypothetical protein